MRNTLGDLNVTRLGIVAGILALTVAGWGRTWADDARSYENAVASLAAGRSKEAIGRLIGNGKKRINCKGAAERRR